MRIAAARRHANRAVATDGCAGAQLCDPRLYVVLLLGCGQRLERTANPCCAARVVRRVRDVGRMLHAARRTYATCETSHVCYMRHVGRCTLQQASSQRLLPAFRCAQLKPDRSALHGSDGTTQTWNVARLRTFGVSRITLRIVFSSTSISAPAFVHCSRCVSPRGCSGAARPVARSSAASVLTPALDSPGGISFPCNPLVGCSAGVGGCPRTMDVRVSPKAFADEPRASGTGRVIIGTSTRCGDGRGGCEPCARDASARGRAASVASCCRRWCRACAAVSFFAPRTGMNECHSDVVLQAAAQDARRNIRHGDFLQQFPGVVGAFTPFFRASLAKIGLSWTMLDGVEGANPSDSKDQGSAKRSQKRATPDVPREARGEQPSSDGDEVTYEVTRART